MSLGKIWQLVCYTDIAHFYSLCWMKLFFVRARIVCLIYQRQVAVCNTKIHVYEHKIYVWFQGILAKYWLLAQELIKLSIIWSIVNWHRKIKLQGWLKNVPRFKPWLLYNSIHLIYHSNKWLKRCLVLALTYNLVYIESARDSDHGFE